MKSKNHPVFVKETPLVILFQGNSVLIHLAAGFSKSVDPLSGMTVNLMKVLSWLESFKKSVDQKNVTSWIQFSQNAFQFFQAQATQEQAQCQFLQIRFFDASSIRFENSKFKFQKSAPVVDIQNQLRILTGLWTFQTDQELRDLQTSEFPSKLSISFSEVSKQQPAFPFPASRLELKDPLTRESQVFI